MSKADEIAYAEQQIREFERFRRVHEEQRNHTRATEMTRRIIMLRDRIKTLRSQHDEKDE